MTKMFKKILIANRGEIACRVMRTAKKMGIATVAVYSDADAMAVHTRMADEAVHIGPSPTNQSYLVHEKILQAIKDTGADCVHPGYGFLSENMEFAKAVEAMGVAFVGPPANAVFAMGDKIESKILATRAGVTTVPGVNEPLKSTDEAVKIAHKIGYPVMLKASAGGGGKGMRLAYNDEEVISGLTSAQNEARKSFGDDRVFMEKFIVEPRHIEIQILGDKSGNILYLGERECSIQRRHQKVLEEAPSPFITAETRAKMGAEAVALARAVGYYSAGTVEFIVDKNQNFYFLEMNTRLQVEHPITEKITNIDIVEWMIRVANGEKLPWQQADISYTGHAIEARVYAEDPTAGFLPSIGRLQTYKTPKESNAVRIDSGVEEGSQISMFYDPMIAKLVAYGNDRTAAIATMRHALNGYGIVGLSHNISFLQHLVHHPRYVRGDTTTNFIGDEYPNGLTDDILTPKHPGLYNALAIIVFAIKKQFAHKQYELAVFDKHGNEYVDATLNMREQTYIIHAQGHEYVINTAYNDGQLVMQYRYDGGEHFAVVHSNRQDITIIADGCKIQVQVVAKRLAPYRALMRHDMAASMDKEFLAPMPGILVRLAVKPGDKVSKGQECAVMEAMKMENILRANHDAVVKKVHYPIGATLKLNDIIIEFE